MAVGCKKLGRPTDQKNALLRCLVTSFFKSESGRIITTETKAKQIQGLADKMITLGKRGDLYSRRKALSFVNESEVVKKIFTEVAPRYTERNGGYTRIIKMGPRRGDSSEMVILELV